MAMIERSDGLLSIRLRRGANLPQSPVTQDLLITRVCSGMYFAVILRSFIVLPGTNRSSKSLSPWIKHKNEEVILERGPMRERTW